MTEAKKYFITGGTGSFGKTFVSMTLKQFPNSYISIYSRDEMKQWDMNLIYENDPRVNFIIGDVRDKNRLVSSIRGFDYVVHAAATKIVPTAEYNPTECIKTNILGAMNVIEACSENNVKKVIALSTDKASNPINLYGATKLASDKLFVASNKPDDQTKTIYSVVRYGNVMGSRGSVIPFFMSLANRDELPITDVNMTRFMITLEDGVKLVWHAINDSVGGEIYVKKIPSMKITDIALAVAPNAKQKIIGIRPGEKLHEQMIGTEDAKYTYEYSDYYKILPAIHDWDKDKKRINEGKRVKSDFQYTSDNNKDWMTTEFLNQWIKKNKSNIGMI